MLSDLPAMKSYVNSSGKVGSVEPNDSIWQWASKKFAGEEYKLWADDPEDYWNKYFNEKTQPYLNSIGCVL